MAGLLVATTLAAAFYMLLIDTVDLPELYAAAGAVVLAVAAFEAARWQRIAEASVAPGWWLRGWRAVASVPVHAGYLCVEALRQLVSPRAVRGEFRAVPFDGGGDDPRDTGRRALAEALGSFAPNTIVIGVDRERNLLLVHQLHRAGGRDAIDVLRLG